MVHWRAAIHQVRGLGIQGITREPAPGVPEIPGGRHIVAPGALEGERLEDCIPGQPREQCQNTHGYQDLGEGEPRRAFRTPFHTGDCAHLRRLTP